MSLLHPEAAEQTQQYSAVGVSLGVHAVLLLTLWMMKLALNSQELELLVETVISEERVQEQFVQELETETEISETMNTVSGGMVSAQIGATSGPTVSQQRIETSESLQEPDIQVNPGEVTVPGDELLGEDLGEGEVTGEIGAVVSGYGAALSRLTQEIIRMMRKQKVLVVWLFDESDSMEDDREEIQGKFHKVYEELRIVQEQDEQFKQGKEILLTAILGYGEKIHPLTNLQKPTADIETIQKAISSVPIDESGKENMCRAIYEVINQYNSIARGQRRKLVVVVVTDESGDDGGYVEDALGAAKKANAPIYILGREAVFGYPYARIRWKDPEFGLWHWLRINRGPETAFPECLQWDGLHARWDVFSSGFGPYEQVRLCKESGGIFFVLPGEEEDLSGAGAHERRQFEFLDMKEYQPLLLSRRDYAEAVSGSEFRKIIWDVIVEFNPNDNELLLPRHNPRLNMRVHHYSTELPEFREQARAQFDKAADAMALLNVGIARMEKLKPLRARERSQRWRANFDLAFAQLLTYRVRLFQYLMAIDHHIHTDPKVQDPKNNEWNIARVQQMLEPDEAQFERIKQQFRVKASREEYLEQLKGHEERAREMFKFVIQEHSGTPWARRAEHELNMGFGITFREDFWDPRYAEVGRKIKLPKP